ncbi:MAG: hypothetical protein JW779_10490 [Candidatus Thorarchaeota archaeon]|nr:hypothetical protein [Candidatus Thorarchaeota archaeon]
MKLKGFLQKQERVLYLTQLRESFGLDRVIISTNLLNSMVNRASEYPVMEEGGVLVGYIESDWDPLNGFSNPHAKIHIVNFIPSGPRAQRSSTHLFSDLTFQEFEFQRLHDIDPNMLHLGSWHSHHCNGLKNLSEGDLNSYFNILHSKNHAHDFYLAVLLHTFPTGRLRKKSEVMHSFSFYLISRKTGKTVFILDSSCIEVTQDLVLYADFISSGYELPTELDVQEKRERSWFIRDQAKEILKEDNILLSSLLSEFPYIIQGNSIVIEGTYALRLVRRYYAGNTLIEYQYPETTDAEGIEILLYDISQMENEHSDLTLKIRAGPISIRHEIFSVVLGYFQESWT